MTKKIVRRNGPADHRNDGVVDHSGLCEKILMIEKYHFLKMQQYDNAVDIIALYLFYLQVSKSQGTNQVYATHDFCKKSLHISKRRIRLAKTKLKELGLILDVCIFIKDYKQQGSQKFKWFIKIVYLNKKERLRKAASNYIEYKTNIKKECWVDSDPYGIRQGLNQPSMRKREPWPDQDRPKQRGYALRIDKSINNALRNSKELKKSYSGDSLIFDKSLRYWIPLNGVKRNKPEKTNISKTNPLHPRNKFYLESAIYLRKIIQEHYDQRDFPEAIDWVAPIRLLVESDLNYSKPTQVVQNRINAALNHYADTIGQEYSFIIQSGKSFRQKFIRLEEAAKRTLIQNKPKQPINGQQFKNRLKDTIKEITHEKA